MCAGVKVGKSGSWTREFREGRDHGRMTKYECEEA